MLNDKWVFTIYHEPGLGDIFLRELIRVVAVCMAETTSVTWLLKQTTLSKHTKTFSRRTIINKHSHQVTKQRYQCPSQCPGEVLRTQSISRKTSFCLWQEISPCKKLIDLLHKAEKVEATQLYRQAYLRFITKKLYKLRNTASNE